MHSLEGEHWSGGSVVDFSGSAMGAERARPCDGLAVVKPKKRQAACRDNHIRGEVVIITGICHVDGSYLKNFLRYKILVPPTSR